jgi:biotin synthase
LPRAVTRWEDLADQALAGEPLDREEALAVLRAPGEELLALLHAAFRVRQATFGRLVKLNMIINAKSGICPEDCGYCSQSIVSTAAVPKYSMVSEAVLVAGAHEAGRGRRGRTASSRAAAGRARVSCVW